MFFENVHGEHRRAIVITGADPKRPPKFRSWQFSKVSHLRIAHVEFVGSQTNGLNIDDGGGAVPSRNVALEHVVVTDLPKGNHDGIKLSGVEEFVVRDCRIERWGGSGIDMVGCHRGLIEAVTLSDGGDNGIQAKGGSSDITIRRCRFNRPGQRGVNLGGSTGLPYFRPKDAAWEARNLTVEGCVFVGGIAAVAFVGVDGALCRFNTLVRPERWAFRILQETTGDRFVPCRNGRFEDNLIVFSSTWASGGVNVGPHTLPETFRFARNHWFCADRPQASRPALPTQEVDGIYGVDPQLEGDLMRAKASAGAHAWKNPG